METLAELKGFIDSVFFDNIVLAGEFNVDFGRASSFRSLLQSFLDDLNLCSADLSFSHSIDFTYERDDGLVRSWPDHVLTLVHHSDRIHDVSCIHSANNFSDHSPLSFCIKIAPIAPVSLGSLPSSQCSSDVICWSEISASDVENYHQALTDNLPTISTLLVDCTTVNCSSHRSLIDQYCHKLVESTSSCASLCFPCKSKRVRIIPGWNDLVRKHRDSAVFWNKLWREAGCPTSGVLFDLRLQTKRKYKYAVRKVKRRRNSIIREKIGSAFSTKNNRVFWKEVRKVKNGANNRVPLSPVVDGLSNDTDISNNFKSKLCDILNCADTRDRDELLRKISSIISSSELCDTSIFPHVVVEYLSKLGNDKSDGSILSSNHLILASPVLSSYLATFSLLSFVMVTCLPHCVTVHLYQFPSLARIPLSPTTTDLLP